MTDTPSAEALAKELLSWLGCDHEPWRIPEMVKRLDAFVRDIALACMTRMRQSGESYEMCACWIAEALDTASERAKPEAGDRNRIEGLVSQYLRDVGAGVDDFSSYEVDLVNNLAAALAEARRAEREKCAQYVREAADGAATFSDDALYRIAAAMRASPEGRSYND